MASSNEEEIRELCKALVKAARRPEGGFVFSESTERYRLHRNRISFHELNYDEIQAVCTGLNQVLLFEGLNTIISLDHQLFWAWAGEVLLSPLSKFFTDDEQEIKQLFESCIRASLAGSHPPLQSREDLKRQRELAKLVEFNTQQLVLNSHLILAYLSFPLLEAMLKKVCRQYIDYSGKVITGFNVIHKVYKPNSRCSSIGDLLYLLHQTVSDADLRPRLDEVRQHLTSLDNTLDPFALVYSWRNKSLHGQTSFPTIGGTLLNIVILIAFNQIKISYEEARANAWFNVQREVEMFKSTGHRSPWSYYLFSS
jgi:hypothetical protein